MIPGKMAVVIHGEKDPTRKRCYHDTTGNGIHDPTVNKGYREGPFSQKKGLDLPYFFFPDMMNKGIS